jgi:hypothetical protein
MPLTKFTELGVENYVWPGRYQQIEEGYHKWFLDGAHNKSELPTAVSWFAEMSKSQKDDHPQGFDVGTIKVSTIPPQSSLGGLLLPL